MSENFEYLLGKTVVKIDSVTNSYEGEDKIVFYLSNCEIYELAHYQECGEEVYIEDIDGDLNDLVGAPLLQAEEASNKDESDRYDSATWTYYRLATIKGYVTIRWFGTSNGYYSESACLYKVNMEFPKKLIRKEKLKNIKDGLH